MYDLGARHFQIENLYFYLWFGGTLLSAKKSYWHVWFGRTPLSDEKSYFYLWLGPTQNSLEGVQPFGVGGARQIVCAFLTHNPASLNSQSSGENWQLLHSSSSVEHRSQNADESYVFFMFFFFLGGRPYFSLTPPFANPPFLTCRLIINYY